MNNDKITILFCGKKGCGKTALISEVQSHMQGFSDSEKTLEFKELELNVDEKGDPMLKELEKTWRSANIVFFLSTAKESDLYVFNRIVTMFCEAEVPVHLIVTKCDEVSSLKISHIHSICKNAVFSFKKDIQSKISILSTILKFASFKQTQKNFFKEILQPYSNVIFAVSKPMYEEKQNLYDFWVDCVENSLKNGINAFSIFYENVEYTLQQIKPVNLLVVESYLVKDAIKKFGNQVKVTSYEKVFCYQANVLEEFLKNKEIIKDIKLGKKGLVLQESENLAFNLEEATSQMSKIMGEDLKTKILIDFHIGLEMPENLKEYDFVISGNTKSYETKRTIDMVDYVKHLQIPITDFETVCSCVDEVLKEEVEIYFIKEDKNG